MGVLMISISPPAGGTGHSTVAHNLPHTARCAYLDSLLPVTVTRLFARSMSYRSIPARGCRAS